MMHDSMTNWLGSTNCCAGCKLQLVILHTTHAMKSSQDDGARVVAAASVAAPVAAPVAAGAGADAGAGAGAGAGATVAATAVPITAASLVETVRYEVSKSSELPATFRPLHLGAFSVTGSGKSSLLNMLFNACGAPGPFVAGFGAGAAGARTTFHLRCKVLAAEARFDTSGLPIIFDCPGTNEGIPLDYFAYDLQNLFWGYYKQGQKLRYATNAATGVYRGVKKLVLGRTSVLPMRDNMIDAFLCCVDVAQFCSDTNIVLRAGEIVVDAGTPLGQLCAQVRIFREGGANVCCRTPPILVFTKWREVETYLREKRHCQAYVTIALPTTWCHVSHMVYPQWAGGQVQAQAASCVRQR